MARVAPEEQASTLPVIPPYIVDALGGAAIMPDESKDVASTDEIVAAFQERMSVSWSQLAREEILAGLRWTPLQAVAFIATGDLELVRQVWQWCPRNLALPHPTHAQSASIHLSRELERKRAENRSCLSFTVATMQLLQGLTQGKVTAYVDAKATLLTGLPFREITFSEDNVGLGPPPPGDLRHWKVVDVNAEDVRRLRSETTTGPAQLAPVERVGAKRGPKPKWDWPNLMGELVRIADQDGLEIIGGQADVERWAIAWLTDRRGIGEEPSESLVREHIAPIFDAIEAENIRRQLQG
jgi:hypothetical protein